jgi:hypothetical protein
MTNTTPALTARYYAETHGNARVEVLREVDGRYDVLCVELSTNRRFRVATGVRAHVAQRVADEAVFLACHTDDVQDIALRVRL